MKNISGPTHTPHVARKMRFTVRLGLFYGRYACDVRRTNLTKLSKSIEQGRQHYWRCLVEMDFIETASKFRMSKAHSTLRPSRGKGITPNIKWRMVAKDLTWAGIRGIAGKDKSTLDSAPGLHRTTPGKKPQHPCTRLHISARQTFMKPLCHDGSISGLVLLNSASLKLSWESYGSLPAMSE